MAPLSGPVGCTSTYQLSESSQRPPSPPYDGALAARVTDATPAASVVATRSMSAPYAPVATVAAGTVAAPVRTVVSTMAGAPTSRPLLPLTTRRVTEAGT